MKLILAVLAATAALILSSCSSQPAQTPPSSASPSASTSTVAAQPADFNQADVDFATMMIPHHQQAVDLAALVPSRSTNPAVLKLASDISAAQGPEIQIMKVFLVQWKAGEDDGHQGHDMSNMQGMVDTATMSRLQTLHGPEFDTLWLQSMIGHHEGAITMAETEASKGTNVDATALARQIITAQQAEITQMKQMLGG